MSENGFTQILTSGCLYSDTDSMADGVRRSRRRAYQRHEEEHESTLMNESKEFPQYETTSGGDVRHMLAERGGACRRFETTVTSNDRDWNVLDRYNDEQDDRHDRERWRTSQPFKHERNRYGSSRSPGVPAVQLKVAHQEPISIRPRNKNPQIVNVCQTFRFPDNFITQNNATRMVQHQDRVVHQQHPAPEPRRPPLLSPCHSTSRTPVGGFFSMYRRHRNMHSQTSRTLIELVEAEQKMQQQQQTVRSTMGPRGTSNYGASSHRLAEESLLASSGSETSLDDLSDVRPRLLQGERKAKIPPMVREQLRAANGGRTSQVPYFDRTKRNRSYTKLVDGGATMGGHYGRSTKLPALGAVGKFSRYPAKSKADNRRPTLEEDALESPFVDDTFAPTGGRSRKLHLVDDALDDEEGLDEVDDESDVESSDEQQNNDRDECNGQLDLDDENEEDNDEESVGDSFGRRLGHGTEAVRAGTGTKEGPVSISGIVDKLQDNVWEVCLEGIWDLMDTASRIDWKAQEKYITVINRKLIEFLKSPRTALCRSACQVSGELFRQAKSTKRPEFDEMVDILLCKTADPNRFIQKDANVALDKLVTYIPTPHTVRAISNRGTIHRNPLVRTATARLLVCICVVAGLDAILGTTANTRTRKTILTMLAKFLTDKNLETRKFGERLYRMLRKHKFFDEYFYKDMDNNLRTNLKRALKGV
uniref:CLASP N-terminal domain-containing protein n=1 Tax=Anopheles coluzzii TaxID=1518534 RepID=A0A8W7PL88_ANOCL